MTQLHALSQDELAQAKQEAAREGAAHQAARRALADAAEDARRLEFRYQRSIEQLEGQLRHMQRSTWARDLSAKDYEIRPARHAVSQVQVQPQADDAKEFMGDHGSYPEASVLTRHASEGIYDGDMQHMPELQELQRLRDAILS